MPVKTWLFSDSPHKCVWIKPEFGSLVLPVLTGALKRFGRCNFWEAVYVGTWTRRVCVVHCVPCTVLCTLCTNFILKFILDAKFIDISFSSIDIPIHCAGRRHCYLNCQVYNTEEMQMKIHICILQSSNVNTASLNLVQCMNGVNTPKNRSAYQCGSCSRLVHSWRCVTMCPWTRTVQPKPKILEWEKTWNKKRWKPFNWTFLPFFRMGDQKPNVMFVLGGPGAGKGTQCARLVIFILNILNNELRTVF